MSTARTERPASRAGAIAATASLIAAACIYLLRFDRAAGLVVDDAWYILLGRALARGEGYRLVSSAVTPIQPVVPPGFPAILSIVFRVSPDFPQNVFLLKSVSIAAMLAAGVITYRYFVDCRRMPWQMGAGIAAATTLMPGLVFLATSTVMAESVFILGQVLTVFVVERSVRAEADPAGRRQVVLAAVLAAATTLVRTTGVALVAAVVLYLLTERRWRRAVLFTSVAAACLLPWALYARAHEPTAAQRSEHGGSIAYAYTDSMRMRQAAEPVSGQVTLGELPARVGVNVMNVLGRDMGAIVVPAFFRGPNESGEEVFALGHGPGSAVGSMGNATATVVIAFTLSAIALIGYGSAARRRLTPVEFLVPLSLAIIIAVPFFTYRYVLPLAPFLLFYLAEGLRTATLWCDRRVAATRRDPWRIARILLLCLVGLDLFEHAQYIFAARNADRAQSLDWIADAREVDEVLGWMKQSLTHEGAVATTNPGLVYLTTGRKTLAIDDYPNNWRRWKAHGVRYAVALRPAELPDSSYGFRLLYQTSRRKLWVIEL
jgi:hypothetical protein